MSEQQREILSYLDREDNPGGDGEVIGREGFGERDVKKLAAQLEKAITVNESRRAKYEDPAKYVPRWEWCEEMFYTLYLPVRG